jgi:hypothetical protein
MPAAPCFFARQVRPKAPATSIGQLTYSSTCRIAAGDGGRKYRNSNSESFHQKTHGHARPESTTSKARNLFLASGRFMEKTVMTRFNAMRSISALGLLIALCGSADAATVLHVRAYHHHHVTSRFANSFASEPAQPPSHYYAPGTNETGGDHEQGTTYGGAPLLPDD